LVRPGADVYEIVVRGYGIGVIEAGPLRQKAAISVEYRNAVVHPLGDVDSAARVERDAVGRVELPGGATLLAPRAHELSFRRELYDARVAVPVGDEHVARGSHCYGRRLEEMRRALPGLSGGAESEQQLSLRTELQHDVPGQVCDPDIVPRVHVNPM